jgi:hypothetical protein
MPSPYDPDAFATRVNFAASYIAAGRRTTRTFDTCCEMNDGDAVAVAVYRRSLNNPKLRANLWRYFGRALVVQLAYENRRRPTRSLPAWAAQLRAEAAVEWQKTLDRWAAEDAARATA